jgi:uncharacterized membrane protein
MTDEEPAASQSSPAHGSHSHSELERILRHFVRRQEGKEGEEDASAGTHLQGRDIGVLDDENSDLSYILAEKYSGAFPHPTVLASLDKVVSGGAERAFKMTEIEQSERHKKENKMLAAEIDQLNKLSTDRRMIIIFSFAFLVLSLGGGFASVMTDHPAGIALSGGGAAISAATAGLVLRGSKDQKGK